MTQNQIYNDLVILIEESSLLSDEQKKIIHARIPEMTDSDLYKVHQALINEQRVMAEHYHNEAQIYKHSAEKKIKSIYRFTERMVEHVEKNEINAIEQELAELES